MSPADQAKCREILLSTINDEPKHWTEISNQVGKSIEVKDWREVRAVLLQLIKEKLVEKTPTIFVECFQKFGASKKMNPVTLQKMADQLVSKGFNVKRIVKPAGSSNGIVEITDGINVFLSPEGDIAVEFKTGNGDELQTSDDFTFIVEVEHYLDWIIYRYEQYKPIKA
jgi:hypothetical protein